jgi:hypothetical protein
LVETLLEDGVRKRTEPCGRLEEQSVSSHQSPSWEVHNYRGHREVCGHSIGNDVDDRPIAADGKPLDRQRRTNHQHPAMQQPRPLLQQPPGRSLNRDRKIGHKLLDRYVRAEELREIDLMLEILTSVGIGSLHCKGIASIARIASNRRIAAILTDSFAVIDLLRKIARRTRQHTAALQRIVDAFMALIVGKVAVLAVRADCYAAV